MTWIKGITTAKLQKIEDDILVSAEKGDDDSLLLRRADGTALDLGRIGYPELPMTESLIRYNSDVVLNIPEWVDPKVVWKVTDSSDFFYVPPSGNQKRIVFPRKTTDRFASIDESRLILYSWAPLYNGWTANPTVILTHPPQELAMDPSGTWTAVTIGGGSRLKVYRSALQLSDPAGGVEDAPHSVGVWGDVDKAYIAVSTTGPKIIFFSASFSTGVVRIPGSDITLPGYPAGGTSWSPDGKYLATAATFGSLLKLIVVRRTGETFSVVSLDDVDETFNRINPEWSPDGRYLTVLANKSSKYYVETYLEIDGEFKFIHRSPIKEGSGLTPRFAWSPDSRYVLIHITGFEFKLYRNLEGRLSEVYGGLPIPPGVIAIDGGLGFSWDNRGRHLVFTKVSGTGFDILHVDPLLQPGGTPAPI